MVRQATADLADTERLVARVTHLRTIVAWADTVHQALEPASPLPDPTRTRFEVALRLAHRVLATATTRTGGLRAECRRSGGPLWQHGSYFDGDLLDISLDAIQWHAHGVNIWPGNGTRPAMPSACWKPNSTRRATRSRRCR